MQALHETSTKFATAEKPLTYYSSASGTFTTSNVMGVDVSDDALSMISLLKAECKKPFNFQLSPRFMTKSIELSSSDIVFGNIFGKAEQSVVDGWADVVKDSLGQLNPSMLKSQPEKARQFLTAAQTCFHQLAITCIEKLDHETLIDATEQIKSVLTNAEGVTTDFIREASHFNGLCYVALGHMLNHLYEVKSPEFKQWNEDFYEASVGNDSKLATELEERRQKAVLKLKNNSDDLTLEDRDLAMQIKRMNDVQNQLISYERKGKSLEEQVMGDVVENSRDLPEGMMGFLEAGQGFGFSGLNESSGVALVLSNNKEIKNNSGTVIAEKGAKAAIYFDGNNRIEDLSYLVDRLLQSNPGITKQDLRATVITGGNNEKIHSLDPVRASKLNAEQLRRDMGVDFSQVVDILEYIRANEISVNMSSLFEVNTPSNLVVSEDKVVTGRGEKLHPNRDIIKAFRDIELTHYGAINIAFKSYDGSDCPVMISPLHALDKETGYGAADKLVQLYNSHTQNYTFVTGNEEIPAYELPVIGGVIRSVGMTVVNLGSRCEQSLVNFALYKALKVNPQKETDLSNVIVKARTGKRSIDLYEVVDKVTEALRNFHFPVFFGQNSKANNGVVERFCSGERASPLSIKLLPKKPIEIKLSGSAVQRSIMKIAEKFTSNPQEAFALEMEEYSSKGKVSARR